MGCYTFIGDTMGLSNNKDYNEEKDPFNYTNWEVIEVSMMDIDSVKIISSKGLESD